jgi:alcohol dehydrogenase class IV
MLLRRLKHLLTITLTRIFMSFMPGASYQLYAGEGSSRQLGLQMGRAGLKKTLVVTDKILLELGVVETALAGVREAGIETVIYDGVEPNPTYQVVDEGRALYEASQCDSILAIGGGSSIDAAKIMGLALTHPDPPQDYEGFGKVKETIPPFYAIPTTAGTGSEATMGAVMSDNNTHEKSVISGATLLPTAACLDSSLMTGLPPAITAATGMDALTHAIEAYIGVIDRGDCNEKAIMAVKLIFENLPRAYADGQDLQARDAMAHGSYMAGQAINQVNVGNVHAIAHQLGGKYGTPHGLANAMILPHVLDVSRDKAEPRLRELAAAVGLNSADAFIAAVRDLNRTVGIPETLDALQPQDFAALVERAADESLGYPVPYLMSHAEITGVLRKLVA